MSLRGFHLLFIALSAMMAMGVALWGLIQFSGGPGEAAYLVLAVISLAGGGWLIRYGIRVRRKFQAIG